MPTKSVLPVLSSRQLSLAAVIYILLFENKVFWRSFFELVNPLTLNGAAVSVALFVALAGVFLLLLLPFSMRPVQKPILSILLLIAAAVSYYQLNYGVVFNSSMIQNIVDTDAREASELMTFAYFKHMVLHGLVPVALLWAVPVRKTGWTAGLVRGGVWALVSVLVVGVALWGAYKDLSLIGRQNRELRVMLNPSYPINSAIKYAKSQFASDEKPPTPIAEDSHKDPQDSDPHLMVLVLGETARAENFSLAGYERETNPGLKQHNVLFYPQVRSCGTATAESVPCIFAHLTHDGFSVERARGYENILDALQSTGVEVTWIDNNSGCKGVCNRVEYINAAESQDAELCGSGECYDEILLKYLDEALAEGIKGDRLLVLHQKGSHGPAYFKRYPKAFSRFQPECKSASPQECSAEEIVNAYDNTILYTDYVVSQVIERLKALNGVESTMIYVSDHGESLGEHGIYLHGLPYFLAPDQQTHVPMVFWMSPSFEADEAIDRDCLSRLAVKPHSHDEIFHTLLHNFEVETEMFEPGLDLFGGCLTKH